MLNYGVRHVEARSLLQGALDEAHHPHGPNQVLIQEANTFRLDGKVIELPIPI